MRSFRSQSSWMWIILVLLLFYSSARCATGEEPTKDGCWVVEQDEQTGRDVRTMEMTLHPAGEPLPSLKYRLLPDDFDMVERECSHLLPQGDGISGTDCRARSAQRSAC